jgi:carbon-monoxide dehydrogenase medium subunit
VRAVLLPAHELGWHGAYLKFTTRSSEDRPAAGVSAILRFDGRRCTDARVVAGAATPVPSRLTSVEDALRGAAVDAVAAADAGRLAESSIEPIDDLRGSARYKQRVVGALVERAILQCAAQGGAA